MGSQPKSRWPEGPAEEVFSLLELVASKQPTLLGFVVDALASSPARKAVLRLASLFDVKGSAKLAVTLATAAKQLDRLERNRLWTAPRDLFDDAALNPEALKAFAKRRAARWRNTRPGTRVSPERQARVDHLLEDAAAFERARALVVECLQDPAHNK